MTNSGFIHYDKSVSKMTTSYMNDLTNIRLHFFMFDCNGSSSIYSTIEDLFLYSKGFEENKCGEQFYLIISAATIPESTASNSNGNLLLSTPAYTRLFSDRC